MSGLKPLTVNTPTEQETEYYAEDDAAIFQSIFGEDGVSTTGQACKATVLSNNKVRIADGVICVGGHFARIPYGDYIDCEIENGQSGKNRNDIIVARFETTGTGGIDTYTCEVKKGTAGSTATDPEIVQEDLYKAGKVRELPLYRVKIEGLSITAVEQLFTLRKTNEELEKELESLNSKIPHFYNGEIALYYYSAAWLYAREFVGKEFAGCYPQVTCLYREGQPNQQTTMISAAEVDSDGYLVIWAYGSGYVSGHMLGVSVSICK